MSDRLRQAANVIFALTQLAAPSLSSVVERARPVGEAGVAVPEMPAGYAFAIWGPIFLAALAYALHQALPTMRERPLYRRIGWWTALAFAAGTLWMVDSQLFGSNWSLVLLITVMWLATLRALLSLRLPLDTDFYRIDVVTSALLGIQGGWLTAATVLNTTSVWRDTGLGTFGLTPVGYAMLTLVPAAGLALLLILRFRAGLWYAGGVLWALTAIAVQNTLILPNTAMAGIVLAVMLLLAGAILLSRTRAAAA